MYGMILLRVPTTIWQEITRPVHVVPTLFPTYLIYLTESLHPKIHVRRELSFSVTSKVWEKRKQKRKEQIAT